MNEEMLNNEEYAKKYIESVENDNKSNKEKKNDVEDEKSKIVKLREQPNDDSSILSRAIDIGYVLINVNDLPSQGLFYPDNIKISIRAANVEEIKHWSTIDETDALSIDDGVNYIIEKCVRVTFASIDNRPMIGSWKDIKEIDRLYLLFAIKELTFKNNENKVYVNIDEKERVEVTKDMLSYFNVDERLMKYYNSTDKCFTFNFKNGESINLYIPSIGVTSFIKNYIKSKQQAQQKFDQSFVKYAAFLFNDYRTLTTSAYEKKLYDSLKWDVKTISLLSRIIDMLSEATNSPKIKYMTPGGVEQEAPLNFQGGIKSIFIISDIFEELV